MANLVVDASVTVSWCFPDERTEFSSQVLQAVCQRKSFAPRLWAYEMRNCILLGLRRGRITREDAKAYLDSLGKLDIQLTDPVSYEDVFHLADACGLTFYDAAYLDLALREGAILATLDDRLRAAAEKLGVGLF